MLAPYSTKVVMPGKPKPQTKVHYCNIRSLAQKERPPMKKEATQNVKGSKEKPLMKKEATPKCKGLKRKTSDEKRGNPKM
jgi:hypothetical protein